MSQCRYDVIAIDLDGTLLGSDGRVSQQNLDALARARDAGLKPVVCTGRGLAECEAFLAEITHDDPVIVTGGAIIACPESHRTLHRFCVPEQTVRTATECLVGTGHPVMVFKDRHGAGFDYLVVDGPDQIELDPVSRWWFSTMNVQVRHVRTLEDDGHPEHTVRMGVCGLDDRLDELLELLAERIGDSLQMHHFPAVVAPEHARGLADGRKYHVLEMFAPEANKWSAVSHLAEQWGVPTERVAAIGDQINDLPMIRGAGLGIAMGNAVPTVREIAGRRTHSNDEHGVAHAISQLLAGAW